MKYLLKSTYLDMFKKRIESMFTITDVKKHGDCGFVSVVSCLKYFNACNNNMTKVNLRREMSKLLVQGIENVSLFETSFPAFLISILDT